jgi:hypothetical protein
MVLWKEIEIEIDDQFQSVMMMKKEGSEDEGREKGIYGKWVRG